MKYDKSAEKEKLEQVNERLVSFFRDFPKEKLSLTAIGNSMSTGFSLSEPGRLLLDRNPELIEQGKNNGLDIQTYHLVRSENNNSLAVFTWIIQNFSEKDSCRWCRTDYRRAIENGLPLLSEEKINEFFSGGSDRKILDILYNTDRTNANIVIMNLGTGSFLDVLMRHGSLAVPNIFHSFERDIYGINAILELIELNNRKHNSNTQVYLCGAPKIFNTPLTGIFMNSKIKRVGLGFPNVTYVPSFPRQALYRIKNGRLFPDPHYNQAEYYHFLAEIEKKIIDNFFIRDIMIDLDRRLFQISNDNDINGKKYSIEDILKAVDKAAKRYESKMGDYTFFIDYFKAYAKIRYPFDYYRAVTDRNIAKYLKDMKKAVSHLKGQESE